MTAAAPGGLASAMLSAAVAARADPTRFGRGRTYVREGAVVDLTARPGVLTGSVIGSRSAPYRVTIAVDGVDADSEPAAAGAELDVRRLNQLVPEPDEIHCSCTCPDGPADPCKHAVATLLAFADQVAIRPELLAEWRSGPPVGVAPTTPRRAAPIAERARADAGPALESPTRTPDEAAFLGDPDDVVGDLPELEPLPVGSGRIGTVDLAAIVSDALDLIRSTYDAGRHR